MPQTLCWIAFQASGGGYNSLFIGFLTGFENLYSLSFSRLRGNPEINQLDLQLSAEDDKGTRSESQYFPSFSRLRGNPEVNWLDLQPSAEDDKGAKSESQYSPVILALTRESRIQPTGSPAFGWRWRKGKVWELYQWMLIFVKTSLSCVYWFLAFLLWFISFVSNFFKKNTFIYIRVNL